jgi:hypothetical protein
LVDTEQQLIGTLFAVLGIQVFSGRAAKSDENHSVDVGLPLNGEIVFDPQQHRTWWDYCLKEHPYCQYRPWPARALLTRNVGQVTGGQVVITPGIDLLVAYVYDTQKRDLGGTGWTIQIAKQLGVSVLRLEQIPLIA